MRIAACLALSLGLSSWLSSPVLAADAFTDAMTDAYPAYRAALYRTNSGSKQESEQAIARTRQAWNALIANYGDKPPAPYDRDPEFAPTLAAVAGVFEKAEDQIADGELAEAHETLESARDLMADLRRRNDVIVYSDHMNAYHAEMEKVLTHGGETVSRPGGPLLLMAEVGKLEYLAARLRTEAPAALTTDPRFESAIQEVEGSVAALRDAVLTGDTEKIRRSLPAIKKPYAKLFLQFG